jgi:nickel-dependent lactate racemase
MKELDRSLSSLQKRSEVHWTELSELQEKVKTKANTAEVARGFVRKEVFTEFMKSLGEEVDRKSTLTEMQRQEQEIQVPPPLPPCPF